MARNKLTAEEADRRIRAQMSNEQRFAFADRVIWNNGTAEGLERAVRSLFLFFCLWDYCVFRRLGHSCILTPSSIPQKHTKTGGGGLG
jgi:hypothetical protein